MGWRDAAAGRASRSQLKAKWHESDCQAGRDTDKAVGVLVVLNRSVVGSIEDVVGSAIGGGCVELVAFVVCSRLVF